MVEAISRGRRSSDSRLSLLWRRQDGQPAHGVSVLRVYQGMRPLLCVCRRVRCAGG